MAVSSTSTVNDGILTLEDTRDCRRYLGREGCVIESDYTQMSTARIVDAEADSSFWSWKEPDDRV